MRIGALVLAHLLPITEGYRKQLHQTSLSQIQPYNDTRLAFLPNIDYTRLYCFDTTGSSFLAMESKRAVSGSTPQATVLCKSDSDCATVSGQPHCLGGVCRECRYATDCPSPTTFSWSQNFCSRDTNYACSECVVDGDCGSGKMCRTVGDPYNLHRKRCVACDSSRVPPDSLMKSADSCEWICPNADEMIGPDGKCTPCPKCQEGQMLVPTEDFALSQPRNFFPTCSMATNPRCVDCPGKDNPCATILSPTSGVVAGLGIGQLPAAYACGTFKCKSDWWLDSTINQCRKCDYRSCPAGQKLVGCGVNSAGVCQPCELSLPPGYTYMSPKDVNNPISSSEDACKPQCGPDEKLVRANTSSPYLCQKCSGKEVCSPGFFFSGCGGLNPGQCLPCAPEPLSGTYWSGSGCDVSTCNPTDCQPGQRLVNCGGNDIGECRNCPNALPTNAAGWVTLFDEQTLTYDTCGVACNAGSYVRSVNGSNYECVSCAFDSCPLGEQLIGCGGDQPGKCGSCPTPNPGLYLVANSSSCDTARCPRDNTDLCPVGEYFSGCGGMSAGACTGCGPLPSGADSYISSSRKCDVQCQLEFFSNVTFDGLVKTCVACNGTDIRCPVGQRLSGCGPDSRGSCQACPMINSTTYWTGGANCTTASCMARGCAVDAIAVGCGLDSPGTCTACSSLYTLPLFATSWTAENNRCLPVCYDGYYRTPAGTCEQCSLGRCAIGLVLSDCGGTRMGKCVSCDAPPEGQCHISFGNQKDDTASCVSGDCPIVF